VSDCGIAQVIDKLPPNSWVALTPDRSSKKLRSIELMPDWTISSYQTARLKNWREDSCAARVQSGFRVRQNRTAICFSAILITTSSTVGRKTDNFRYIELKSGYSGIDIGEYGQPGSNGLTLDKDEPLTINQHGNRRVIRLEKNGQVTVLADRYEGKRLNSPNDLAYRSDGSLYFTDSAFRIAPQRSTTDERSFPIAGFSESRQTASRHNC